MHDILSLIATLNRPRLLVQAARHGVDDYSRTVHLPRLLGTVTPPRNGPAILALLDREAEMNDRRRSGSADYSVARHVEMLIALMGEARLLRAATRAGVVPGAAAPVATRPADPGALAAQAT